jgi:HTH-type transcriptional regulator/antitoxin MqsA
MKDNSICTVCEEGTLHEQIETNSVEFKSQNKELPLHFSECDCCGSDIATPEQSRKNKQLMTEFKKQVDGLLTGRELKKIRLGLGLTQAEAAKTFGGGPVAFSKYEADDVAQSEAMDKLLRVSQAVPDAFSYLTNGNCFKVSNNQMHMSSEATWITLDRAKSQVKNQKRTSHLRVISSNNICSGDAYDQLMAVGQ